MSLNGPPAPVWPDHAADGFGAWNEIHCGYGPGSSLAMPADYDGLADLSEHSDDEYWYIDYAANGFNSNFDDRQLSYDFGCALGPPVRPSMQLFQRGPNTLRVIVQAVGPDAQGHSSASRIESSLQGVARTSVSSSGFQILRTFTGLQPNTRYCVTATEFDSLGTATRTACFYTAR